MLLTLCTPRGYDVNTVGDKSRRRQVYSPSMTRRPSQLSFLACLLALLTACGSALPSPVLWQCHHAARIVLAPLAAWPSAMPCRMAGMAMSHGPMACCPAPHAAPSREAAKTGGPPREQALGRPACDPTFTLLDASPAAQVGPSQDQWGHHQAPSPLSGPLPALSFYCAPITLCHRQRPPPAGLFLSDALARPRLRAPPAA